MNPLLWIIVPGVAVILAACAYNSGPGSVTMSVYRELGLIASLRSHLCRSGAGICAIRTKGEVSMFWYITLGAVVALRRAGLRHREARACGEAYGCRKPTAGQPHAARPSRWCLTGLFDLQAVLNEHGRAEAPEPEPGLTCGPGQLDQHDRRHPDDPQLRQHQRPGLAHRHRHGHGRCGLLHLDRGVVYRVGTGDGGGGGGGGSRATGRP